MCVVAEKTGAAFFCHSAQPVAGLKALFGACEFPQADSKHAANKIAIALFIYGSGLMNQPSYIN